MNTRARILIVAALTVTVVAAVALKRNKPAADAGSTAQPATTAATTPAVNAKLPKLIDLGAGKCIPCKMMKPILDELKRDYADRFTTEFIDVWENPDAGKQYGIEVIPTQIFYDATGKELFRHVGFFGKEDILAKWKEFGVNWSAPPSGNAQTTNQVIAYYFHGTVRCETCLKIERLAKEEIDQRFGAELAAGLLTFTSVNYDEPENRAYQQQYKLPCPSLVVVRREAGKDANWRLLGNTWQLVEDTAKFNRYIGDEIAEFLKAEP